MKKTFLSIALVFGLISMTSIASAQIKVGPAIGVNFANIAGDETSDNAMKLGFHVGGVVQINISDNFAVAPGALYSMKGAQSSDNSDIKVKLDYIEIPINAKYITESGFNVFAGPYLGLLLSAKGTDGTTDVDIKDFMQSMDFGINAGLGYDLESGLGISAQYGLGLANILKDAGDFSNTNAVIAIMVRYMFGE